jgi:hypothetical protein
VARVYSKRLVQQEALSGTVNTTVPPGVLWIVRDIDYLVITIAGSVQVVVGITAPGPVQSAIDYFVTSSIEARQWRGRQVLNAGDELSVAVTGSGSSDVTISGYELSLP